MNKRKIILIFSFLILAGVSFYTVVKSRFIPTAEAHGYISITYNNLPLSGPIFDIHNFLPGDCVDRTVDANNSTTENFKIILKTKNIEDSDNLSSQLTMLITQNANSLYSNSLKQFFNDTTTSSGLLLSELAANSSAHYKFRVCFNQSAGNQYQNAETKFDLVFSDSKNDYSIPQQCYSIKNKIKNIIVGTKHNDYLQGTLHSDLIFGLDGNDTIRGDNSEDCIVGGDGNDNLDGGNASDYILGGKGSDTLNGDNGDDYIWGEEGKDTLKGSNGDDYLDGGEDKDALDGGNGKDKCLAGETNSHCEL